MKADDDKSKTSGSMCYCVIMINTIMVCYLIHCGQNMMWMLRTLRERKRACNGLPNAFSQVVKSDGDFSRWRLCATVFYFGVTKVLCRDWCKPGGQALSGCPGLEVHPLLMIPCVSQATKLHIDPKQAAAERKKGQSDRWHN